MKRLAVVIASVLLWPVHGALAAPDSDEDDDDESAQSTKSGDAKKASKPAADEDEDEDDDRSEKKSAKSRKGDDDDDKSDKEEDEDDDAPVVKKKKAKGKGKAKGDGEAATHADDHDAPEPDRAGYHHIPPRATFAAELLGATPLDKGNRNLFGMGGGVGLGGEIYVAPILGVSAGVTLIGLAKGDGMSSTTLVAGQLGPRVHLGPSLFGDMTHNDAWVDAHVTYGSSGGIRRPGFDIGAAIQWEVKPAMRIGPMIRYEFGKDPRDTNAQLLTVGLAIGFGGRGRTEVHIEGDADGDGIIDSSDMCPDRAAGPHPDPNREGCPIPDSDGDGVLDHDDECPDDAQGDHPDPARPGCPIVDTDEDGIPDKTDRCPDKPGQPDPFNPAQNGCPAALARVVANKIEILQQIFFELDSATIKDESFPVLEAVAKTMKDLGNVRVRVEGHTDQQGTDEYNLDLSKRRARAVAQWLIQNGGVDSKQLETEGYGRSRPIVSGKGADLSQNRRVEFVILGQ